MRAAEIRNTEMNRTILEYVQCFRELEVCSVAMLCPTRMASDVSFNCTANQEKVSTDEL